MLLSRAQYLPFSSSSSSSNPNPKETPISSMRTALFSPLSLLRSLSLSSHHHHHRRRHLRILKNSLISQISGKNRINPPSHAQSPSDTSLSTSVEHLAPEPEIWDFSRGESDSDVFSFDSYAAATELKQLSSPSFEVKELDELPEQWRRSKLAWLCKELPSHKHGTVIRLLNAQRKWITQEDATYVAVHCMRIRENDVGFRVYKWMMQQHWYQFDFGLSTKLAYYMGKERKFTKCREIFDDIINQGCVPSESTFHILTIAYLSAPVKGCLEEACGIYNRMIQLGGYQPRLGLHNALFQALISKPEGYSKHYLNQAEFIYHNLVTTGLEIHKVVYGGLIWLHSYQDTVDKERINSLREEMRLAGIEETREVIVSILRACSKEGDIEEAERTWSKLLHSDKGPPSQAFVYKMEVYAKVGDPMRSLEIFRQMPELLGSHSVSAYHKIIEVLSKAQKVDLAESLMEEFVKSGQKPLMPSYIDLMNMYFNLSLHEKLELVFSQCLEKCNPNRTIYTIYLQSLVKTGNIEKAEEIFNQMYSNVAIGVHTLSCNSILSGYLSCGDHRKAGKIYDLMCQKKYDIEPTLMEKIDYVLSLSRKVVKKSISPKLSKEQREALVGLLLGGLRIESDEASKNHVIHFDFSERSNTHSILKRHIHDHYHEWLHASSKLDGDNDDVPYRFSTISHTYFGFYADQFWPKGRAVIPKLIHRWLSPRVLAYWYMYSGHRTSSGEICLKLRGSKEGVLSIVKALRAKSLECRVKSKGRVFWIGFWGNNSTWFWKLTEPFILDDLKDFLKPGGEFLEVDDTQDSNFDSGPDTDEASDYSDNNDS